MRFSIVFATILPMAVLGQHKSYKERTDKEVRRPPLPSIPIGGSTKKAVIECPIKHQKNILLGSFLPIVTMALGSPPQEFSTLLDTGSGDLIVGRKNSPFCGLRGANCSTPAQGGRGSFDLGTSINISTIGPLDAFFFNGERDQGTFRRADAIAGGVTVPGLQFGLAENSTNSRTNGDVVPLLPLLGIGPVLGETPSTPTYANLPARMREAGSIKSNIYGVYLNDFRGLNGSIVFGGVDAAKFTGELKEAPLLPNDKGIISAFNVQFSSLQLVDVAAKGKTPCNRNSTRSRNRSKTVKTGDKKSQPTRITNLAPKGLPPAFIDTGNAEVLVPRESVDILAKSMGAEVVDGFLSRVKCDLLKTKALRFGFNRDNAVVDVPLELMVVPTDIAQTFGKLPPGTCNTVVGSTESLPKGLNIASLGAPMMQAMYIAFDIERKRLMFAPAVLNSTQSDIRELSAEWKGTVRGTGRQRTARVW